MTCRWLALATCAAAIAACGDADSDARQPDAAAVTDTGADADAAPTDIGVDDVAGDAAVADVSTDTSGGASYPNAATVFGYPWTTGAAPTPNLAWRAACEAEVPLNGPPSLPPEPATPTNCAGDPTKCGPSDSQDCTAEPARSAWMHRVTLDTATYPDAVCNDGSPGVLEVRRGTGAGAGAWLIWFKGGSSCRDQHRCARRWCGNQSGTTYDAAIMSTDWNGDGVVDRPHCARAEPGSAMDPNLAGNPFADANVVKIWYCSSDNHMGRATVDHEDVDADGDGVDRHFSLQTRGRRIVEAALATLDGGVTSDDGAVTLPPLTSAQRVVIAGSSAGSLGAMQNLDAMHEHIVGNAPAAVVRGVLDANVPPSDDVLDAFSVTLDAAFDGLQTPGVPFSQWRRADAVRSWTSGWYGAADVHVDQSCLAHVQADEGDAGMHRCLVIPSLLLSRDADGAVLETPTFVRYDLGDPVVGGAYKPCADAVTGAPCYSPNHSFLADTSGDMPRWLDLADSSDHNRATLIEIVDGDTSVTGVFAPTCSTHTGFVNDNFSKQQARDYTDAGFVGPTLSFMEALAAWLQSQTPGRVIDASASSPAAPSAQCDGGPG